ncbi:secreted RxLR effector protein 78-like [Vicia villosa]|uniref:secreted RxLR effector protein 78-like n=1 Tax=Vicia villosa TaxID=3911 RepID=UPI00273AA92C|nr:secreted RxLR effector protein 78-like [Vicia villosa]
MKVDFEKAYDRLSWNLLRFVLKKMGFGERWLRWMEGCVFTSSLSIIINGSVTKEFNVEKGLRQGDPLSPFLFVIAAEVLTGLMNRATSLGDFRGFLYNEIDACGMLQFADDTIFIAEGDLANIWTIKSILRGFEIMSGVRVN